MRYLLAMVSACVLVGCGGSPGSDAATVRFSGTWQGNWVNVGDASDAGTSTWTIDQSGNVDGHDFDPGRQTTFHVVGKIDSLGNLTSTSTPTNAGPATLDGPFTFSSSTQFSGVLAWGVSPPLSYRYVFQK